MKKITLISCLFFLIWISGMPTVFALASITSFTTTIQRLEISKDGGITWITIFDGNARAVDLAQLKGQSVGTLLGEAVIPAGTYNRARVRVTTATVTFSVDGAATEVVGATNLTAATRGVLVIDLTALTAFPLTRTYNISVSCKHGAVTEGTIDFDAGTSYSAFTYSDDDGAGGGVAVTLLGLTFEPRITVAN
jgi:hypothetical protein